MVVDGMDFHIEQLGHPSLAEPEGFILKKYLHSRRAVRRGVKDDFAFARFLAALALAFFAALKKLLIFECLAFGKTRFLRQPFPGGFCSLHVLWFLQVRFISTRADRILLSGI